MYQIKNELFKKTSLLMTFLSLFVLLILAAPQSAFGNETESSAASMTTTYIDSLQMQISVPASLGTDTPASEGGYDTPCFEAWSGGSFATQVFSGVFDSSLYNDIADLSSASDDQIQNLCDAQDALLEEQDFDLTSDPVHGTYEANGVTYLTTTFDATYNGTAFTNKYYCTILNGTDIHIEDYMIGASLADCEDRFDTIVDSVAYGSPDEIAAILADSSDAESSGSLNTQILDTEAKNAPAIGISTLSTPTTWQRFCSYVTGSNGPLLILLIIVFIIFFAGSRFKTPGNWHDDFLSLKISKGLQGFCAVLIILHHTSQQLADKAGPLFCLENIGVCFVGIFFFFSGYGLIRSLNSKEHYLVGFFKKRLPVILVPFYICIAVFLIVALIMGNIFYPLELIGSITGWLLINSHMWYIVEIFIFYLAFYLIFHFIKNRKAAITIMTLFIAAITVGSLLLGHGYHWFQGEWWFNTSLVFAVGMLIAQHEDFVVAFVKRFYIPCLAVFAIATILLERATMYMLNNYSYWSENEISMGYSDKFRCLAVQLPFVICFVLLILIITMKLQFKNRVLSFLGTISLELYLIHNLFLEQFSWYPQCQISNPFFFTLAVLGCSIGAATILHLLDQKLIGLLKTKHSH